MALVGFVALAVNIGLLALMRTQAQSAADSAAMAGARTLNGTSGNNSTNASAAAVAAAGANSVLGQPVQSGQVSVTIGKYYYSQSQSKFVLYPTETSTDSASDNWTAATATVTLPTQGNLLSWIGVAPANITATATAVHRPRDVAIVLDFSQSMRYSSLLGIPNVGPVQTNNPESVYPQFSHYSSSSAALQNSTANTTSGNYTYGDSNVTVSTSLNNNRPAQVGDFNSSAGSNPPAAFSSAGNGDSTGYVAGDKPMKTNFNTTANYAQTVKDLLNITGTITGSTRTSGWETNGYGWSSFTNPISSFQGYTRGPSYWGKTFFIWPPDPRGVTAPINVANNGALDWRKRFFLQTDGVTPVDDNSLLWDSSGNWRSPTYNGTSYYKINYQAIVYWLLNTGANPFPSQLRAGRIQYYGGFPSASDATLNTRFWAYNPAAPAGLSNDERFWKEYIDYALGVVQTGAGAWSANNTYASMTPFLGYGDDFAWGTVKITPKSSLSGSPAPYMEYDDNPRRPRTHFWFGPMTMIDFLGNSSMAWMLNGTRFNWMPGTAHEAPMYALKFGIQAALSDVQNNHPNDMVGLIFYSNPQTSATDTVGRFNRPRVPLGRLYQRMQDALWFPPSTLDSYNSASPVSMWAADNNEVPRAWGETSFAMGLMLAYNQFSGNTSLQTYNPGGLAGDAGGLGRKGAQRLVILETDGLPNRTATATFNPQVSSSGVNQSWYSIRYNSTTPANSEFPSSTLYNNNDTTVTSEIYSVARQLVASETAASPGFGSPRKPVYIHCIGFGPIFDPSNAQYSDALSTLQQIEVIGNVQSADTNPPTLAPYKIINGDDATVTANLRKAITTIMQGGVQVSLVR
jgi:hypothetical protein